MSKVPAGWEKKILKDILKIGVKNGFSPNAVDYETGHWVLSLAALGDNGININGIKSVIPTDNVLNSQLISGDFLVSRSNTPDKVGRSIKFRGEVKNCSYPDLMMKFRVDTNLAIEDFIEHVLKGSVVREYYKSCAAGSSNSMVKINKSIVEKTPLLFPPLPEQTKIAQILSTWDKAIATTEQLIGNSQQQKKALMQSLLTGKKRLPGFEGEWSETTLGEVSRPQQWPTITSNQLSHSGFKVFGANGFIGYYSEYNHEFECVTVTCRGSTCGEVSLIPEMAYITGNSMCLDDINPLINSYRYLYYALSYRGFNDVISGSAQPQIVGAAIKKIKINLPPLPEQQKIAQILTAADNEIELLKKKLAFLKQEKTALMQQLLTGKRRVKINATEECMDA